MFFNRKLKRLLRESESRARDMEIRFNRAMQILSAAESRQILLERNLRNNEIEINILRRYLNEAKKQKAGE